MTNEQIGKTIPLTYELLTECGGAKNLNHLNYKEKILCICSQCNSIFYRRKINLYKYTNGNTNNKFLVCSMKCLSSAIHGKNCHPKEVQCKQCGKKFLKFGYNNPNNKL